MNLNVVLAIAAVFAAWIMLSLVGNERQRQLGDFEAQQALNPPKPAAQTSKPAAIPTTAPPPSAKKIVART